MLFLKFRVENSPQTLLRAEVVAQCSDVLVYTVDTAYHIRVAGPRVQCHKQLRTLLVALNGVDKLHNHSR